MTEENLRKMSGYKCSYDYYVSETYYFRSDFVWVSYFDKRHRPVCSISVGSWRYSQYFYISDHSRNNGVFLQIPQKYFNIFWWLNCCKYIESSNFICSLTLFCLVHYSVNSDINEKYRKISIPTFSYDVCTITPLHSTTNRYCAAIFNVTTFSTDIA